MNDQGNLPAENKSLITLRDKKGFTLVELMIVIAIIGIIAAIAVPQFMAYRQRAYDALAQNDAKNFYKACVHGVLEAQGFVVYWSGNLPPGYTGMKPTMGAFAYHPSWGSNFICGALFKHPSGKKTYYLDSQGGVRIYI